MVHKNVLGVASLFSLSLSLTIRCDFVSFTYPKRLLTLGAGGWSSPVESSSNNAAFFLEAAAIGGGFAAGADQVSSFH